MKTSIVAVVLAVFGTACGSSPTTPSTSATPMSVTGTWVGSGLDSSSTLGAGSMMGQTGAGTMTWQLTQTGSTVTGSLGFSGMPAGMPGSFTGTMDQDDMVFTFDTPPMGAMMSSGCAAHVTGTVHLDEQTMTMTGTYDGTNSCYGAFADGLMTMTHR